MTSHFSQRPLTTICQIIPSHLLDSPKVRLSNKFSQLFSKMMEFQIKIFENANIAKYLDIFGCGRDSQLWLWCIFFKISYLKSEESRNILYIAGVIHSFPVLTHHGKKQFFPMNNYSRSRFCHVSLSPMKTLCKSSLKYKYILLSHCPWLHLCDAPEIEHEYVILRNEKYGQTHKYKYGQTHKHSNKDNENS